MPITLLPRHMLQVCLLTSPPDPPRRRFYYLAVVLQTLSLCEPLPVKPFSYSLKQVSSLTFDGFRDCQSITEPVYPLLASEGHYLMSFSFKLPAVSFRDVICGGNTGIPQLNIAGYLAAYPDDGLI